MRGLLGIPGKGSAVTGVSTTSLYGSGCFGGLFLSDVPQIRCAAMQGAVRLLGLGLGSRGTRAASSKGNLFHHIPPALTELQMHPWVMASTIYTFIFTYRPLIHISCIELHTASVAGGAGGAPRGGRGCRGCAGMAAGSSPAAIHPKSFSAWGRAGGRARAGEGRLLSAACWISGLARSRLASLG